MLSSLTNRRRFADLSEQEILALAISSEEDDARIYRTYAQMLRAEYPASAEVFDGMAQRIIDSPALADYWRAVDPEVPAMRSARETVRDLLEAPIARAKAAGLCRADLEKTDISLISGMLGAALRGKTRDERAQLAGRALQLLRGGLQGAASEAR